MLELIKQNINGLNNNTLTIAMLKNNASRNPKVHIEEYNSYFPGHYSNTRFGVYEYIVLQAISKAFNRNILMNTNSVSGEPQYIVATLKNIQAFDFEPFINFTAIAPSNLKKGVVKAELAEWGTTNTEINDLLQSKTHEQLLALYINKERTKVQIFYNIKEGISKYDIILALVFAYKSLKHDGEAPIETATLIQNLSQWYKTHYSLDRRELVDIIYDYCKMKCNPEYIIDKDEELRKAIRGIKERKLSLYKKEVDKARTDLEALAIRLSETQQRYNDACKEYEIHFSASDKDDEELLRELVETKDLLERSPLVTHVNVDKLKFQFRVVQPLQINDLEGWQRVKHNTCHDEVLEELLDKCWCENPEVELSSYADMYFNFETEAYGRLQQAQIIDAIPNTHIMTFECFGTYRDILTRSIRKNDGLSTVSNLISAASTLNYADGTVMNRFVDLLTSRYADIKMFKRKGETTSFSLIDYREEKKNEANAENQSDVDNQSAGV